MQTMKIYNIYRLIVPALAIMVLASGCQSGKKGSPPLIDDLEEGGQDAGLESFSQIYHLYPSPAEMLSVIDITEMTFDESLLNPASDADKYLDNKSRTYMLGAYMTDLAYAALFDLCPINSLIVKSGVPWIASHDAKV